MPSLSSTRAAAALVFGVAEGCTQPASARTILLWLAAGQGLACFFGGTLARSLAGSIGAKVCPSFSRYPNSTRLGTTRASAQRIHFSFGGRGSSLSIRSRLISRRRPYLTPEGQVVSQLRQVRQRSRCSRVFSVTSAPSRNIFMR